MRHTSTHSRSRLSTPGIALLIALAGLASACDREGDARKAIDAANIQLTTLDSGLGNAPASAARDKVYADVVSSLSEAAASDRAAYASSANVLLAKAHAGLAESPAAIASAIEADSLNRARVLRADLAQWLEMSAIAIAAEKYDPAPEIAALDSQIQEIQGAIAGLTRAREQVAGRHASLTSDAESLASESAIIRNAIGELRIRSTTVSATEAAAISEQIREQSRAADALDRKASEILAEASPLVPQISEIDLNIAGLNNQIESLRAAQAAATQRGQDAATEARDARALADTAADRLDKAVNELNQLREGELARAYEQALRSLASASTAARKAATDDRTGSKLAEGAAFQQAGDLLWQQAHGLTEYHALTSSLAAAQPPLPRSGAYEAFAADANTARGEALTKAAEAYEQAMSALTSSGARGEASERLDRVGRMLELIIQATQGQTVDWSAANRAAPSEDETAAAPTGEATGDAPDLAVTLQGWLDQIKAGDATFVPDAIYSDVPAISAIVGSVGDLIVKSQQLDTLCKEKFGQSLTEFAATQGEAAASMGGIPSVDDFTVDMLDIQVAGDTAMVRPIDDAEGQAVNFRLIDGAWKVDLSQAALPPEFAAVLPMLDQFVPMVPRITAIMDELIAETDAGSYVSTQAVFIAQQQKMMPVIMEIMGSMQPPPGGG